MLLNKFMQLSEPFKSDTLFIIQTYMDAGYECYIVGGPVRDMLLGLDPKDIDFATNCPLEETKKIFKNVIPTGEEHGTLTIHLKGENYEVTRYRKDVDTDGRRATIEFSETFEEDAERRDLTINAIGFNPLTNEIKDSTGGLHDFENKLIRFVGNPEDRIKEDFLRSIRFIRFTVKLDKFGFKPEEISLVAAIELYDNSIVSVERIYQELDAIFIILKDNQKPKKFIVDTFNKMGIFKRFIKDDKLHFKVLSEIFETYDYFPLVLVMDGDIQTLRLSSEYKKLFQIFKEFENSDFRNQSTVKLLLNKTDDYEVAERVLRLFKTLKMDNYHKEGLITLKTLKNKASNGEEEPYKISQLAINGNDLIKIGLKGKELGETLNMFLRKILDTPALNKRDILLSMLN